MFILGIETTCDETGIGLIEFKNSEELKIHNNELASQVKIHQQYGGVVPLLAAREHEKNLPYLLKNIEKKFDLRKIDYLAFSVGPGLLPALISGKNFVKSLAQKINKKIIPVDHLRAHLYSILIKNQIGKWQKIRKIPFPAIGLIVSGGHTNLYLMHNFENKKLLGKTLDDAVGEILDKCARFLSLPYPGGPQIEKYAKRGNYYFSLPKPLINHRGYDFSFSGLKSAFIDLVTEIIKYQNITHIRGKEKLISDLAYSLQKTAFEVLISKTKKAIDEFQIKSIIVSGGVAANQTLKKMFRFYFPYQKIFFPERSLATDNGLNIALAGYFIKAKAVDKTKLEVYDHL